MEISRVAFETARLRLARYRLEGEQARSRAAAHATQVSADALDVDRVGLWLFRRNGQVLTCVCQYDRRTRMHSAGQELAVADHPIYMEALREHRVIAADDALSHPLTLELTEYMSRAGITALLDAPIIRDGRVLGVVCHEHVGAPRVWGERDLEFASAVADMVTLIFEQADRLELEAALQEQAEQRQESQKMEALGRMACGVAHDFNNVLGVISLSLGAFGRVEAEHPKLRGMSARVDEMVQLGQRLTKQLLAFGREHQEIGGSETSDFAELLGRMTGLLESAVGSRIRLVQDLRVSGARVAVEPSHLEQLVLNLVLNARDAIPESGRIDVVLREAGPEDEVAPDSLVLEVRDDGSGMDASTCARIFEPYFTTKPAGTGLGLATVYGVVRRAGGNARVISEPGRGTTVLVALPRAYQA